MPSTHTCLHIHVIFSTKERFPHIVREWRDDLHAYLGGTLRGLGATALQIGGVADHVHLLFGMKPTASVSELVRETKKASTSWVRGSTRDSKFLWQEGYGAFAVSRSGVQTVAEYIRDQEEHHRTKTFQEEYLAFLRAHDIDFDPRYVW